MRRFPHMHPVVRVLTAGVAAVCSILLTGAAPAAVALWELPAASPGAPHLSLNVATGPPGTRVVVTGTDFPPLEIAAIYIDLPDPYVGQPGPRTDDQGRFSFGFATPGSDFDPSGRIQPAAPGPHQICADTGYPNAHQPVAAKACAQFVVQVGVSSTPSVSPSQNPAQPSRQTVDARLLGLSAGAFVLLVALAVGIIYAVRRSS